MHEQHVEQMEAMRAALKADQDSTSAAHLKIAPYKEKENIQDFLEAEHEYPEGIRNELGVLSHTFTHWESM